MRPIIGVNGDHDGDCLRQCGDVTTTYALCHSPLSLSAPRSHGKHRSMLTGTGVGSNFRFDFCVSPGSALQPASKYGHLYRAVTDVTSKARKFLG